MPDLTPREAVARALYEYPHLEGVGANALAVIGRLSAELAEVRADLDKLTRSSRKVTTALKRLEKASRGSGRA